MVKGNEKTLVVSAMLQQKKQLAWAESQENKADAIRSLIDLAISLFGEETSVDKGISLDLDNDQKEWLQNQSNITKSLSMLIKTGIANYGKGDIGDALIELATKRMLSNAKTSNSNFEKTTEPVQTRQKNPNHKQTTPQEQEEPKTKETESFDTDNNNEIDTTNITDDTLKNMGIDL